MVAYNAKVHMLLLSACSHLFNRKIKKYNNDTAAHKWPPSQSTLRNVMIYR